MLQSPKKRRAKLQSNSLSKLEKENQRRKSDSFLDDFNSRIVRLNISEVVDDELKENTSNNKKSEEQAEPLLSNSPSYSTEPRDSVSRKKQLKSVNPQSPRKYLGTLQLSRIRTLSSKKSRASTFDADNLNIAKESLASLDAIVMEVLHSKMEHLSKKDQDNQTQTPNPANLIEVLQFLSFGLNNQSLFSGTNSANLRDIITGMFGYFDSTSMIDTLSALYSKANQCQKLNIIFMVKEIIRWDDFYHGCHLKEFRDSVKAFIELMRYSGHKDCCIYLSQAMSTKRLLTQPWGAKWFTLDSVLARSQGKKKQIEIERILFRRGNVKRMAATLANDLSAITLAYVNSIPIIEFSMTKSEDSTPCLSSFKLTFEKISNFLGSVILNTKSLEDRKRLVTLIIWAIYDLLWSKNKLRDFNSALILQGVLSGDVGRLEKTFAHLDDEVLQVWNQINKTLDSRNNYKNLQALMSEDRPYLPIIPNHIRMCKNIQENNKAWPEKFEVIGNKYFYMVTEQERLRGISLTFKTDLYSSLASWEMMDDDELHLMSLAIEPKSLYLPEYESSGNQQSVLTLLQKILDVYAKNKHPLKVAYKVFHIVGNDLEYEIHSAEGDEAVIVIHQWLHDLLSRKVADIDEVIALFKTVGKTVELCDTYKKCVRELMELKHSEDQPCDPYHDYVKPHKSHLNQYGTKRDSSSENEESEYVNDFDDEKKFKMN